MNDWYCLMSSNCLTCGKLSGCSGKVYKSNDISYNIGLYAL